MQQVETLIRQGFFGSFLRKELYFTQNSVGEHLSQKARQLNGKLLQAKGLDRLLRTNADEFARTTCLPVSFAVGINYLLDRKFFSPESLPDQFSLGDLLELAVLSHLPGSPTIDTQTGNWYYSFLLDVACRLGLSGRIATEFESSAIFIDELKRDKALCLVSLDNQVVPEITLKRFGVTKMLRVGRHIFLLHGWSENLKSFLYSDVFNPIPNSDPTLNLWVPPSSLDSYLMTERMPGFSSRALVLTQRKEQDPESKIRNPILARHPELSLSAFFTWLRQSNLPIKDMPR
ncbi:MAG: hypothetical protein LiPW16_149 [Microgenomates group bacterium LiPW_16]|nr:MAG: hypothetical protein LiPW16_149 [Microgenomates group bacterium LiPW_16]